MIRDEPLRLFFHVICLGWMNCHTDNSFFFFFAYQGQKRFSDEKFNWEDEEGHPRKLPPFYIICLFYAIFFFFFFFFCTYIYLQEFYSISSFVFPHCWSSSFSLEKFICILGPLKSSLKFSWLLTIRVYMQILVFCGDIYISKYSLRSFFICSIIEVFFGPFYLSM